MTPGMTRDLIGKIYLDGYLILLHTKIFSCGPRDFREPVFFLKKRVFPNISQLEL